MTTEKYRDCFSPTNEVDASATAKGEGHFRWQYGQYRRQVAQEATILLKGNYVALGEIIAVLQRSVNGV